jgi:adenylate cyclase
MFDRREFAAQETKRCATSLPGLGCSAQLATRVNSGYMLPSEGGQAFALVKEHFYIMERLVREHDGAIVKTIGDAVMAVYTDPREAVRTAVEMIEAFDDLETAKKLKNAIVVKVGIHHGPCIAVTLNERIDYFGTTVNIAARVQGLSDGRDVMASGAIFSETGAEELLKQKGWANEQFTTSLKGLKSSYQVHKLHAPNA